MQFNLRSPIAADELQALLQKLGYRRGPDVLLSVGDLVNKGLDSEQVGVRCNHVGVSS